MDGMVRRRRLNYRSALYNVLAPEARSNTRTIRENTFASTYGRARLPRNMKKNIIGNDNAANPMADQ